MRHTSCSSDGSHYKLCPEMNCRFNITVVVDFNCNTHHLNTLCWASLDISYKLNQSAFRKSAASAPCPMATVARVVSSLESRISFHIHFECLWIKSTTWIMCSRLLKMSVSATNSYRTHETLRIADAFSLSFSFSFRTGICIQMQIKRHTFRFVHFAFSVLFS